MQLSPYCSGDLHLGVPLTKRSGRNMDFSGSNSWEMVRIFDLCGLFETAVEITPASSRFSSLWVE